MMRFYWRWARLWLFELRRRPTEWITLRLLDRMATRRASSHLPLNFQTLSSRLAAVFPSPAPVMLIE